MASTNQTTNYGLPIYSAGDRASWTDTNQPFEAIDTAVKKAVDDSADAISGVATVTETANTALGTATSAAADASSALTGLDAKQDKTDNNLNTTAKTVVGAINEVANEVAGKQNATDNNLSTTDKTVVGAINEVAGDVALKQDATDNNLVTTAKTIVGAINEVAGEIPSANEKVEVAITSSTTFTQALTALTSDSNFDSTKLTANSKIRIGTFVFYITQFDSMQFSATNGVYNSGSIFTINLTNHTAYSVALIAGQQISVTDQGASTITDGSGFGKIALYY